MAVLVTTVEAKVSLGLQLVTYRNGPHNHFPGLPVPPATSRCHSLQTKPEGPQFPLPHLFLAACRVAVSGLSGFCACSWTVPPGPPARLLMSLQGSLASVGLFGYDALFAQGPREEAAAMSQIGIFLVQIQEQALAQAHRPQVVSISWSSDVCLMCFYWYPDLIWTPCVGLRSGTRVLHWTPSPRRPHRWPYRLLL